MDFALEIHPDLRQVYEKSVIDLHRLNVYTPDNCHSVWEVIRAHFLIADFFYSRGEGIGGVGPRDLPLLVSAVSRQWVGFDSALKWNTTYERSATLLFGLVRNHAFHDANKRTAFLSTAHYLLKNGFMLTKSERELEDFTVEIAEKGLGKHRRYRELIRNGDHDPDVRYISWFLRNTVDVPRIAIILSLIEI